MPENARSMSAVQFIRALLPPWRTLRDPLVQYGIRRGGRIGERPWALLVVTVLTCLAACIFMLGYMDSDSTNNRPLTSELLPGLLGLLMGGLGVLVMIGHWRLLLAIAGRAASLVAGRRASGDWDLIAITPMSKTRWLRSQLTIIGWQVFPLVRQLVVVQFLLVMLGFGYLIAARHAELNDSNDCFIQPCYNYDEYDFSTLEYTLLIAPIGIGLGGWILVETGIFTAVALLASSLSQRVTMSMLYSFLGVFMTRIFLTFVLIYGGTLIMIALFQFSDALGLSDFDMDFSDLDEDLILVVMYYCMGIPILAFFLEWLPVFPAILMAAGDGDTELLIAYVGFWLVGLLVYIILPLLFIAFFSRRTIRRLEKRE